MAYVDLLLHINSYPTPTTPAAIDEAIGIAASLGGGLTGLAVEVTIPPPSNRLADYLAGLSAMASRAEADSREACRAGLAHFEDQAKLAGVFEAAISAQAHHLLVADHVAMVARTRDICILPLIGDDDSQTGIARSVVFGSGRPILIFRAGESGGLSTGPDMVVVAWDGSRCAARAVADSLPILVRAKQVKVLTVLNEKAAATRNLGADVGRHLQMYGVSVIVDEVDADGHAIGDVLGRYLKHHGPDLLVMGAYGHSRAQEFLLGGATEHTLRNPICPVLLSH